MKILILRIFFLAIFSSLLLLETQAQRGRDRDRGRDRRHDYFRPNSYWNNNRNYNNRGWGYNGYRPYPGRRYFGVGIVRPRVMVPFGGVHLNFYNGRYYGSFGNYWRSRPPIGIRINVLPYGYHRIYAGAVPYYYYGGTYYRQFEREYEVVDAPLGASIPELPAGANVVVINGQKFYELQGTYYKEDILGNSEIWYTVVGKDGKLNTEQWVEAPDSRPAIGSIIDKLPDNCRTVVVNNVKYFVSPDEVYFEEIVDGKTVRYKVVGK